MALNDVLDDITGGNKTPTPAATVDADAIRKAEGERAATILTICAESGAPAMAGALIRDGASLDQARLRVQGAKEIHAAVALARKSCPQIEASLADTFIAAGTSVMAVKADLMDRIVAVQATTSTRGQHDALAPAPESHAASAALWDSAVAKVNAQFGIKP